MRVFLCDDQIVVTEGLQKILSTDPEIEICGVAHDGADLLEQLPASKADLVLIDLKMPVMNGILATRRIHAEFPEVHVLVLTTYDDDEWIFDALRAGAQGYLLKDLPPAQLISAIKGTMQGKSYIDPKVTARVIEKAAAMPPTEKSVRNFDLSKRESQILKLIAQGFSNAEIGDRLFLSEGTVRNYTRGLFAKLDVSARTQAAVAAIKYGLVDISEI